MVLALLFVFTRMRRHSDEAFSISKLLTPLSKWKTNNEHEIEIRHERFDEIKEATDVANLHLTQNCKRNLEQRAKVQLVCSILPLSLSRGLMDENGMAADHSHDPRIMTM